MFGALANLNPADIKSAVDGAQKVADQIRCIEERLAAMQRMLEYEFGSPVRDLPAHDPRNLPLIAQITSGRLDIQGALGKAATRGHISNIGNNPADLFFESRGRRVGPYRLIAGANLDLSFALEAISVTLPGPATTIQLFMQ